MDPSLGAPYSAIDVILVPGLCFFASLLFRFLAWNLERQNKKSRGMKIAAYVPIAIGLYIAFQYLTYMFNGSTGYIYMQSMQNMKKVQIAHWLAILSPVFLIVLYLVWWRIEKRLGRPISI